MKKLFLFLSIIVAVAQGRAANIFESGGIYYSISVGKASVTKGSTGFKYTGEVIIPDSVTYEGTAYPVTSIQPSAFFRCDGLTSVTIPLTMTSIGDRAFSGCTNLTSVSMSLNTKLTYIGSNAFTSCGFSTITLPYMLEEISGFAFSGCANLTSVLIPVQVRSIGTNPFAGCGNLTSIEVAEGNYYYDSREGCNAIIRKSGLSLIAGCKNTVVPEGIRSINKYAFDGCTGLTSLQLPESVNQINERAFSGCPDLVSLNIPEGVTSIGSSAFMDCSSLASTNIPEGVTSIGSRAFWGCSSLASINLHDEIYSIGDYAFYSCASLSSLELPDSLRSIGNNAFNSCSGLTSVCIPQKVTSLGNYAFDGCSGLTKVTIESNDVVAGTSYGKSLVDIFGDQVREYVLGEDITAIGDHAFHKYRTFWNDGGSGNITSLNIPGGVLSIGEGAFVGCSGLTSLILPNSLTSIGLGAFQGCSGLTSISIPDGVTSIGGSAFLGLTSLKSVKLGSSLTTIENALFDNCTSLASVTFSEGPDSIGWHAFYGCTSLTSITFPNSVKHIGSSALAGCTSLASVTFGSGLTSIGEFVFDGSNSITDVYCYAGEVPDAPFNAFYNCSSHTATLHVPAASIEAYKTTDPWKIYFGSFVAAGDRTLDIVPMQTETEVTFDDAINDQTDLSGMVVGNMYVTLDRESGDGYLPDEGCLLLSSTTTEEQVEALQAEGQDISVGKVQENFNGIILEVPCGKGAIDITAQTGADRALCVKVGGSNAMSYTRMEPGIISVGYEVPESQYVFIYASETAGAAGKRRMQSTGENAVKIYSVKWTSADQTGIASIRDGASVKECYFTPDGKQLATPWRGLNIVRRSDGSMRKVLVK